MFNLFKFFKKQENKDSGKRKSDFMPSGVKEVILRGNNIELMVAYGDVGYSQWGKAETTCYLENHIDYRFIDSELGGSNYSLEYTDENMRKLLTGYYPKLLAYIMENAVGTDNWQFVVKEYDKRELDVRNLD